jgi:7-carboxy-7-deazaguanine synthase
LSYRVKELFLTLQGEGLHAGRVAVFLRFSGCNLWNGNESQRAQAVCTFCDTDFVETNGPGGGNYADADTLVEAVSACWGDRPGQRFLVCTGGEPTLQLDSVLIAQLRAAGFYIAIETNGTREVLSGIDWITVSPKSVELLTQTFGHELKLVFPSAVQPEQVAQLQFSHFLLSPLWEDSAEKRAENLSAAIEYCQANPQWRLSVQQHKLWGIP